MQRSFFDDECDRDLRAKRQSQHEDSWLKEKAFVIEREHEHREMDSTCAAAVLERLLIGPATTAELKHDRVAGHRFSCGINKLRAEGYLIDKAKHDNGFLYTLTGRIELVRVTDTMKESYYATSHWRDLRMRRIEFDGRRCVRCHASSALEVHHWIYDLFREDLQDVETLCHECHTWLHSLNAVRATFPKFVESSIADRLVASAS